METNSRMHPRNMYKTPLNFKKLCEQYPKLLPYTRVKNNGKVIFDFKNPDGLRCLTKVLLKKDFDLDVVIPEGKLVPTLPLRLNYILWLEDLLFSHHQNTDNADVIKGIDIGTGATCIYPLLIAKKNCWKMLGTDIDEHSVQNAYKNVENNDLQHLISVVQVSQSTFLLDIVNEDENFDFCMCNPPFFDCYENETESMPLKKNRAVRINAAKMRASGSQHETASPGGEIEFIKNIISDSMKLRDRIKIYTVMIGCKASLKVIIRTLKELKIESFITTQFCQGLTVRWAVAWTFVPKFLKSVSTVLPPKSKRSSNKPISWKIKSIYTSFKLCKDVLCSLLHQSEFKISILKENDEELTLNIVAYRNTWTGLRKKRREHLQFGRMDRDSSGTSLSTSTLNVHENNSLFSQLHNGNELVQNSCMLSSSVKENENIEKKLRFVSSVSEDEVPKKT